MTGTSASSCARVMMPPVGLLGYGRSSAFVRGVIAPSSASGVRMKPFSLTQRTVTGVPPASCTQGT